MHKLRLKAFAALILYGTVTISLVIGLLIFTDKVLKNNNLKQTYITKKTISNNTIPVVNVVDDKIVKPFVDTDIKVLKDYYDAMSDEENQENSLIFFENTYIPNTGIDYGKDEEFNVVSISNGKVLKIEENDILGNIVTIDYNEFIAKYSCLSNIQVNEGQEIISTDKIGTSGTCNISKDIGNHIHLEIIKDGIVINPKSIVGE